MTTLCSGERAATVRESSWQHVRAINPEQNLRAQHAHHCHHLLIASGAGIRSALPENSSGLLCTPGRACFHRPLGHLGGHGASRTTSALMWWPNRTISTSLIIDSAPRYAAATLLALYGLASLSGGSYSYISPDLHLSPPCCGILLGVPTLFSGGPVDFMMQTAVDISPRGSMQCVLSSSRRC